MQTRKKSISLVDLGIQVPQTSRVHRPSISSTEHPAKRIKREHSLEEATELSSAASPTPKTVTFADRPLSSGRNAYENTPPPSPGANESKIDFGSINDDIVAGVIKQLDETGNRPHLIKELASVLSTTNGDVARSANPAALLSSRLATYMRRSWTAESPCLVAKELIPVHPRKVFYYLTTSQRQELPASALEPPVFTSGRGKSGANRIISPSLSNASQDDETSNCEDRKRAALSPSPEVELGGELEELIYSTSPDNAVDFPTPPVNGPSSFISVRRHSSDSRRAQSPAFERDEQEFIASARDLLKKGKDEPTVAEAPVVVKVEKTIEAVESDDVKIDYTEDAATLSLSQHATPTQSHKHEINLLSSPMVKAIPCGRPESSRLKELDIMELDGDNFEHDLMTSWDIRRPQDVGLDELDDLFDLF